jgi:hypothetical protein
MTMPIVAVLNIIGDKNLPRKDDLKIYQITLTNVTANQSLLSDGIISFQYALLGEMADLRSYYYHFLHSPSSGESFESVLKKQYDSFNFTESYKKTGDVWKNTPAY